MLVRCRTLLILSALVAVPMQAIHADLIINGDFSLGNTGFSTDYTLALINTTEGQYTVGTNPQLFNSQGASYGDHTTGTGLMLIVNGSPTSNQTVWQQTVTVGMGTSYVFSGWVASWGDLNGVDPNPARLQFFVNGSQIGTDFVPIATDGQWSQFLALWNSGPATSATIRIVDTNTVRSGNDFTLDDLSLRTVPEPASLALISAGLGGLLLCRRRFATVT